MTKKIIIKGDFTIESDLSIIKIIEKVERTEKIKPHYKFMEIETIEQLPVRITQFKKIEQEEKEK
jgi:hypothetical protein